MRANNGRRIHQLSERNFFELNLTLFLDRNRKGFGLKLALDQRPARFHLQLVAAHLGAVRFAPGFAGSQIELPAVPGTTEQFAPPAKLVRSRLGGFDQTDDAALAQRSPFMRAAVADGEVFAVDRFRYRAAPCEKK